MKEMLLTESEIVRSRTLKLAEEVTEAIADRIPEGFRNNIRWHLGHIYTIHEQYIFGKAGFETKLPESFLKCFGNGTSPADWDGEPATLEELKNMLQEQSKRMEETFSSKDIYAINEEPIALGSAFKFYRLSELISFMLFHEGSHIGFMQALKNMSV